MSSEENLCAELRAYFDGPQTELPDALARVLYQHVPQCETCQALCLEAGKTNVEITWGQCLIPSFTFAILKNFRLEKREGHATLKKNVIKDLCDDERELSFRGREDVELISQWREGRREAFDKLYHHHWGAQILFSIMLGVDWKDVERLWREAAVRVFVSIRSHLDVIEMKSWLLRNMHSVLLEDICALREKGEVSHRLAETNRPYTIYLAWKLLPFRYESLIAEHFLLHERYASAGRGHGLKAIGAREAILRARTMLLDRIRILDEGLTARLQRRESHPTIEGENPCARVARILTTPGEDLPNDTVEGWSLHATTCALCERLLIKAEDDIRALIQCTPSLHGERMPREGRKHWKRQRDETFVEIMRRIGGQ